MTADRSNDAASNSDLQKKMAPIEEEIQEDATVSGEEMEEEDPGTTEDEQPVKQHVIMRFDGNGHKTNVGFLLKEVFQWLTDIQPELYIETENEDWKSIKDSADFPSKETDFLKCFAPTKARGASGALLIAFHLFSNVTVETIKAKNQPFVQYLQSKKIGLKTSCAGSKEETTIFAFLGFNPDKTHRDSLLEQLRTQLQSVKPDSAEAKLLQKAKQILPVQNAIPPFQLQVRWINAKNHKFSTKTYAIVCATPHADFLRSFIVRSYHEKRILGLGKVCAIGGRNIDHLPAAITWNNNFIDGSSILSLVNISKQAMDQPLRRQTTVTATETTTIRRILLSEGKVVNLTESRDISEGRWIIAISKDKTETLTRLIAGTITKLYENGQIREDSHLDGQEAPMIDINRPTRRNSGTSAISNDDNSIQSMHSKAWSDMMPEENAEGSVPKKTPGQSRKLHFIFDPSSSEFPALPTHTTPPKDRQDNASLGSTSTVTKADLESFQSKMSKDLATNLKECRSIVSSMSGDEASRQSFIDEIRAERENAAQLRAEADMAANLIRSQSDARMERILEMNQAMMHHMQAMLSGMFPAMNPYDPRQQHQYPMQQQPTTMNQHMQPPQQFHPPHPQNHHPSQHHHQQHQQHQQRPTQATDNEAQQQHQHQVPHQLFPDSPPRAEQQYHYFAPPQQRPAPRHFKRPDESDENPPKLPTITQPTTDSTTQPDRTQDPPLHPSQPPIPNYDTQHHLDDQQVEETVEFEYLTQAHQQHEAPPQQHPKRAPGGTGTTYFTPERKKDKLGSNATAMYYDTAQEATPTSENSTSESAGGVQ
jgi:hypothetical protein